MVAPFKFFETSGCKETRSKINIEIVLKSLSLSLITAKNTGLSKRTQIHSKNSLVLNMNSVLLLVHPFRSLQEVA